MMKRPAENGTTAVNQPAAAHSTSAGSTGLDLTMKRPRYDPSLESGEHVLDLSNKKPSRPSQPVLVNGSTSKTAHVNGVIDLCDDDSQTDGDCTIVGVDAPFSSQRLTSMSRKELDRNLNELCERLRVEEASLTVLKTIKLSQIREQSDTSTTSTNDGKSSQIVQKSVGNSTQQQRSSTAASGGSRQSAINTDASIAQQLLRKPPSSGYQLFTTEKLPSLNHLPYKDRLITVGRAWNTLHEDDRRRYNQRATALQKLAQQMNTGQISSQLASLTGRSGVGSSGGNNTSAVQTGSQLSSRSGTSTTTGTSALSTPTMKPKDEAQFKAQLQSAAKAALRSQIEKNIQQIANPKPQTPEMNFMPTLTSAQDFIWLVGLEEVVKGIIDMKTRKPGQETVRYVFNPFTCVQCGTDFTPVWKRVKPGKKQVICESCVSANYKRQIRQEHTAKLKSAIQKSAQLEKELDEKLVNSANLQAISNALKSQQQSQQQQSASATAQHHQQQHQTSGSLGRSQSMKPSASASALSAMHNSNSAAAANVASQVRRSNQHGQPMSGSAAARAHSSVTSSTQSHVRDSSSSRAAAAAFSQDLLRAAAAASGSHRTGSSTSGGASAGSSASNALASAAALTAAAGLTGGNVSLQNLLGNTPSQSLVGYDISQMALAYAQLTQIAQIAQNLQGNAGRGSGTASGLNSFMQELGAWRNQRS